MRSEEEIRQYLENKESIREELISKLRYKPNNPLHTVQLGKVAEEIELLKWVLLLDEEE